MAHHKQVPKTFCTTREAAAMLGVSLRTAQLWTESGLLEAWKTDGGHRRISRQSIDRLLASPVLGQVSAQATSGRRASDTVETAEPAPFSILVVEDDAILGRLYELRLGGWPMRPAVSIVGDGYEALIRIGHTKPDLLITDLQMPGMDGFRMLQTIRSLPELSGMHILVVSGLDAAEIAQRGGVPEGIPIFPKPVPFVALQGIAERAAAAKQAAVPKAVS
jgi:excisionase family DNA binding protein